MNTAIVKNAKAMSMNAKSFKLAKIFPNRETARSNTIEMYG